MPERQPVRELPEAPPITPQARPVNAYVPPPAAREGQDLAQLADALKRINPAIQKTLGLEFKKFTKEEQERAREDFLRTRQPWKKAVEQGKVDRTASPWYRAEYDRARGLAEVKEAQQRAFQEYLQNPDVNTSDDLGQVRKFFNDKIIQQMPEGETEFFEDAVLEAGSKAVESLMDRHLQNRKQDIEADFAQKAETAIVSSLANLDPQGDAKQLQKYVDDLGAAAFDTQKLSQVVTDAVMQQAEATGDTSFFDVLEKVKVGGQPVSNTLYAGTQARITLSRIMQEDERQRKVRRKLLERQREQIKERMYESTVLKLIDNPETDLKPIFKKLAEAGATDLISDVDQFQDTLLENQEDPNEIDMDPVLQGRLLNQVDENPKQMTREKIFQHLTARNITPAFYKELLERRKDRLDPEVSHPMSDSVVASLKNRIGSVIRGFEESQFSLFGVNNQDKEVAILQAETRFVDELTAFVKENDPSRARLCAEAARVARETLQQFVKDGDALARLRGERTGPPGEGDSDGGGNDVGAAIDALKAIQGEQ